MATLCALQRTRQWSQDKAAGCQGSQFRSPLAFNLHGSSPSFVLHEQEEVPSVVLLRCPAVELLTAMKAHSCHPTAKDSCVPIRALRTALRTLPTLLRGPGSTCCPDGDLAPSPPGCPGRPTPRQKLTWVATLTLMTPHLCPLQGPSPSHRLFSGL